MTVQTPANRYLSTLVGSLVALSMARGHVVSVDAVNGTASGGYGAPFLTIAGAIAFAAAGDVVEIRPGTYVEQALYKNGVSVFMYPGAIIQSTDAPAFTVDGAADWNLAGCGDLTGYAGVWVTSAAIDASIEVREVVTSNICFDLGGAGRVSLRARYVKSTAEEAIISYNEAAAGGLRLDIAVDTVETVAVDYRALDMGGFGATSRMVIRIGRVITTGNGIGIYADDPGAVADITIGEAVMVGSFVIENGINSVHIGRLAGGTLQSSGGVNYFRADNWSRNTAVNTFTINHSGGDLTVSVGNLVDGALCPNEIVHENGAGGGSIYLAAGRFVSLGVVAGNKAIKIAAGGATVRIAGGVALVAGLGATNAIAAGAAVDVQVHGNAIANLVSDGNITIKTGTLTVDADLT